MAYWFRARVSCGIRTSRTTLPILAADKLNLPVFLPQVGYRVLEKHRVQTHVGAKERHVAKHSGERIETGLALDEVIWIIPWRPGMMERDKNYALEITTQTSEMKISKSNLLIPCSTYSFNTLMASQTGQKFLIFKEPGGLLLLGRYSSLADSDHGVCLFWRFITFACSPCSEQQIPFYISTLHLV
jgi:hypothetical protein